MLAIPKNLLPHTVEVKLPKDTDGFGGQHEEPVTIEHVRVEPVFGTRATDYQKQNGVTGVLIIDAVNSVPAMELPAGTLVTFPGEASPSNVFQTTAFYAFGDKPHHWESELK